MSQRLIISAMCLASPGTMGGNSKITLEMARHLRKKYEIHFIVPDTRIETIKQNIPDCLDDIHLHVVSQYPGNDKFDVIGATRHYLPQIKAALSEMHANRDDWLFGVCDFHPDAVPGYLLQKQFGYRWLPSAFLFVPFIVENLVKGYKFPPLLYLLAWTYAKLYVFFASFRATGFVITNKSDFCQFPWRFRRQGRLFPYYGGVNTEQLQPPLSAEEKRGRVVFCSRLHQQKGIDGLLDIWKMVVNDPKLSDGKSGIVPRLLVIGNGDPAYESYLKDKANRLGIADSVEWLGYVNNEDKFKIYASARIHVHPTVFDNNGMVAAEALCSGLPVVMYDLPSLRHVYNTGCLKVKFGDKAAYAKAIVSLLTDDAIYAKTAPNESELSALRAHWDWKSRAEEFDCWLEKMAAVGR